MQFSVESSSQLSGGQEGTYFKIEIIVKATRMLTNHNEQNGKIWSGLSLFKTYFSYSMFPTIFCF